MIKIFKCPIVESNSGPLDAKGYATRKRFLQRIR